MPNPHVVAALAFQCNMLYKQLKTQTIHLAAKESREFDAGTGVVLVPQPNSKVFIHWLTDSGKMRSTFTMTYATQIFEKVKLINGLNEPTDINVIQIG